MNWRQLFIAVVGLLREGFPFPNWENEAETADWLHRNEPHLAKIILLIAVAVVQSPDALRLSAAEFTEGLKAEADRQGVTIDMNTILKIVEFITWLIGLFTGSGSARPSVTEG